MSSLVSIARPGRYLLASVMLASLLLVVGCASIPPDHGRAEVDELVSARGQQVEAPGDALLSTLTGATLSAESAVRIALINNPDLQSSYASLGFGAADVYEAGRIRNPVLSASVLDSNVPGEGNQVALGLVASFTDLITLRARSRLSRGAFAALQQQVGAEVLAVASATEKAYYHYVGAMQVAALRQQTARAMALSADLAQRFADAGNLAARELAMQKAAASEARLEALEAEAAVVEARTELAALLGLSAGDDWQAPAALHLPLHHEDELDQLLQLASDSRLDLAAATTTADVLADRLGVVNWARWLGDLDMGIEHERETDGARLTGPTADWEIPIFNQNKDALLRADTELQIAINDVRRISLAVENEVRKAHAELANARQRVSEYRDQLIPQRIATVARAQEELNFMLIGVFELIELKREEYDAYQGYLEAITSYWVARADLALATGRSLPSAAHIGNQRIDVNDLVAPADAGIDHSGHAPSGEDSSGEDHENMQHSSHKHHHEGGDS